MLYCAQNEESNWCNGLLEVPPLIIVAVMLPTLAAGGKGARRGITASWAPPACPCIDLAPSRSFRPVKAWHEHGIST